MSSYTSRRQRYVEHVNQILHPSHLFEGIHIGMVSIIEPNSKRIRALQATAAFAISYGREDDESRTSAAKRGWKLAGPNGLLPHWRGIVQSVSDNGVWIDVTGKQPERGDPFQYLNQGVEALPDVTSPLHLHDSLEAWVLVQLLPQILLLEMSKVAGFQQLQFTYLHY